VTPKQLLDAQIVTIRRDLNARLVIVAELNRKSNRDRRLLESLHARRDGVVKTWDEILEEEGVARMEEMDREDKNRLFAKRYSGTYDPSLGGG